MTTSGIFTEISRGYLQPSRAVRARIIKAEYDFTFPQPARLGQVTTAS